MNLVAMKTHKTTNVANAPTALIASDFFQFVGAVTSRNQWTTMPDCDNVNDRKTPTA